MGKNYRSELVGAFGCPIDENPTGVMEEAAFAAKGLNYRYLTIKVNPGDLKTAMEAVKIFHMKGINLTIPHKVEVLKYLDELSKAAQIIGAVNMVVNKEGKLWGDNTDGKGFLNALYQQEETPLNRTITILGAGGAARAISVECALAGAKQIHILNIEKDQGEQLCNDLNFKTNANADFTLWENTADIPEDTEILVNATCVGLYPNIDQKPDINYDTVSGKMLVCDVIFNDPHTLFLKEAEMRGAKTINGLGMLVNQGALNFEMWTGIKAPIELMKDVLKREFGL